MHHMLICLLKWFFTVFSCNTLGIMKFHLLFLTRSEKKRDSREPSPLNKLYQIQRQVSCALSGKSVLVCLLLLRETAHGLVCTGREARPYWLPTHPDTRPQHLHHHRSDKHTHTDADTHTHTGRSLMIKTHNWLQTHLGYNCIWGPLTNGEHVKESNHQRWLKPYPYISRKTGSKSVCNNFSKW